MALFGIQRYLGDEEKKNSADSTSAAENILADIHRKAELRRLQTKESPAAGKRKSIPDADPLSPVAKKARSSAAETTPKSDKKKKKKKEEKEKASVKEKDSEDSSSDSEAAVNAILTGKDEDSKGKISHTDNSSDEDGSDVEDEKSSHAKDNTVGGFTVLGAIKRSKVVDVQRVLPEWLARPTVIEADMRRHQCRLEDVTGLADSLQERLQQQGITYLFPVQVQMIEALLSDCSSGYLVGPGGYRPRDVCCSAPTGSGKTLAYVLPLVQVLLPRCVPCVRVLVVLPVADLASQVYGVFVQYCQGTPLRVAKLTGHKSLQAEQALLVKKGPRFYESRVDIVVATPGRLVDHLRSTEGFSLEHLRFLVLDEADRMMEDYKQDWLHEVEKACPRLKQPLTVTCASVARMEMPVQKLLFSATLSHNPEKLQELKLFLPRLFTSVVSSSEEKPDVQNPMPEEGKMSTTVKGDFVGKYTTPGGLTEHYIEADLNQKPLIVLYMLHHLKFRRVLCFTNSVESTHRLYLLVKLVGGDVTVQEFSSSMNINRRQRMLKQFAAGKLDMLICTDAMARGMDVEGERGVQYVLSYDAPRHLETYVHRAGRTARAGHSGTALTLLEKKEIYHFKKMCKDAGKDGLKEMCIKKRTTKPFVAGVQEALKQIPDILKSEKQRKK